VAPGPDGWVPRRAVSGHPTEHVRSQALT
jgi:hypothetical protein